MLLENLPTHVASVGINMVLDGILEFLDALLSKQDQGCTRIVTDPPLRIGETLEKDRYPVRGLQSSKGRHDAASDFPAGVLAQGSNGRYGSVIPDRGEGTYGIQPDIARLMGEKILEQGDRSICSQHPGHPCRNG